MSNEVKDEFGREAAIHELKKNSPTKTTYTKKEIRALVEVTGHSERWVREQLGLPITRWQRFNSWRRRLVSNKYYKMFDWAFMMTLLLLNMWFIGAGCGREDMWKEAVKEGVAVKEGKTYKWKKPDAEQNAAESK